MVLLEYWLLILFLAHLRSKLGHKRSRKFGSHNYRSCVMRHIFLVNLAKRFYYCDH